jgi:putative FmdB family regulatory protein
MPTYQYRCTECGRDLEVVQKFSDASLTECPTCAGQLRKVFNAVGVVFKGSGFYRTDSRAAAGNGDSGGDKAGDKKGEKSTEKSGESSDGKPAKVAASASGDGKAPSGGSGTGSSGGGSSDSAKGKVGSSSSGSSSTGSKAAAN